MRIYPAIHYTMGGLWVDYNLMSNVPGLFVLGEANFSDHGANRLGASALMQGLADGYFVLPYTIGDYLRRCSARSRCRSTTPRSRKPRQTVDEQVRKLLSINGNKTVDDIHRELGARAVGQLRHGPHRADARRRRSPRSPRSARSSGRTSACSATNEIAQPGAREGRARRRLPRVRRADVPRRAAPQRSRAAATSARSTRPKKARRCATTSTSRTSPRGSGRAPATSPSSTRKRSTSSTSTRRRGRTSRSGRDGERRCTSR